MEEEEGYPSYPVFKGLQKPLEFFGLRGRYIYWAFAAVGGGILGFIIGYIAVGFVVGLVALVAFLGIGVAAIFIRQSKGLHSKRITKGIFILYRRSEF